MGQEKMAHIKQQGYETFEHGGDIGVRGYGESLEEAFINGAKAMFSIMVEDIAAIPPRTEVSISASSFDLIGLFVAYLNALIAEADLNRLIFSEFFCKIGAGFTTVSGVAIGDETPLGQKQRGIEVKGATFSEAKVEKKDGLWIAQCVVDV